MDKTKAVLVAIIPIMCVIIGLVIGIYRYIKYGKDVKDRVEREFIEKRARGGFHSFYHKRPDKRVNYETFGVPMYFCFLIGIIVMIIIFKFV